MIMRRAGRFGALLIAVCVCAGVGIAAAAQGRVELGLNHWAGTNSRGWGTDRPRFLYNGGHAAGSMNHIRWSGWERLTAHGVGLHPTYKPTGGYYLPGLKIQLRATDRGHCYRGGPRVSKKLYARWAARPGGPLGNWSSWSGRSTLCVPYGTAARTSLAGPAGNGARRRLPRMIYPVINYASRRGGLIWHVWFKPRHWSDGDDLDITDARWVHWTSTSAVARVHVNIGGRLGTGTVRLSSPGYCRAAHAYGFLTETDSGRPWAGSGSSSHATLCANNRGDRP